MYKDSSRPGFTMVEVVLFFAVSAALMLGIITGVAASISRQRYNDTVNDVAEYVRTAYSDVQAVANGNFFSNDPANPSASYAGRSEDAIYGKLLVFSNNQIESFIIKGKAYSESFTNISTFTNPATGNPCSENDPTLTLLSCLGATKESDPNRSTYKPVWDGYLENTGDNSRFSACVLIVRSPATGSIHTYSADACGSFDLNVFSVKDVDFCIDSEDNVNGRRRNLRIKADSSNSSGVILPALNSVYSISSDKDGSKCGNGAANDKNYSGNHPN